MLQRYQRITSLLIGFLFFVGFLFRVIWSNGGPYWTYWIGNLAIGIFLIVPGVAILIIPDFTVVWLQTIFSLSGRRDKLPWKSLGCFPKFVWLVITCIEFILGIVILGTTLYQMYIGCTPVNNCSLF